MLLMQVYCPAAAVLGLALQGQLHASKLTHCSCLDLRESHSGIVIAIVTTAERKQHRACAETKTGQGRHQAAASWPAIGLSEAADTHRGSWMSCGCCNPKPFLLLFKLGCRPVAGRGTCGMCCLSTSPPFLVAAGFVCVASLLPGASQPGRGCAWRPSTLDVCPIPHRVTTAPCPPRCCHQPSTSAPPAAQWMPAETASPAAAAGSLAALRRTAACPLQRWTGSCWCAAPRLHPLRLASRSLGGGHCTQMAAAGNQVTSPQTTWVCTKHAEQPVSVCLLPAIHTHTLLHLQL